MTTGFFYDDRFLDHRTGTGHPERPDRLRAIMQSLHDTGLLDRLEQPGFPTADPQYVQRLHDPAYVQRCFDNCLNNIPFIDTPDSAICPASADTALLAAGAVLEATTMVMSGELDNAFCAVRPPGHHAEANESMGFCLFGNVALAADHLTREHELQRVAIVDFDVHHGNGTQHLLEHRDDILFISLHQDPRSCYPGTGFADEIGKGVGEGFTLNIPLAPGGGDDVYQQVFESKVLPRLAEYKPQFLLVSAGFDAAAEDPLAGMNVTTQGFEWMTRRLVDVAHKHCAGKFVSVMEGGYDLGALSRGVAAHVEVLLDAGAGSNGNSGG